MTRQYIKNNHYPVWNWCNVEKKKKKEAQDNIKQTIRGESILRVTWINITAFTPVNRVFRYCVHVIATMKIN